MWRSPSSSYPKSLSFSDSVVRQVGRGIIGVGSSLRPIGVGWRPFSRCSLRSRPGARLGRSWWRFIGCSCGGSVCRCRRYSRLGFAVVSSSRGIAWVSRLVGSGIRCSWRCSLGRIGSQPGACTNNSPCTRNEWDLRSLLSPDYGDSCFYTNTPSSLQGAYWPEAAHLQKSYPQRILFWALFIYLLPFENLSELEHCPSRRGLYWMEHSTSDW